MRLRGCPKGQLEGNLRPQGNFDVGVAAQFQQRQIVFRHLAGVNIARGTGDGLEVDLGPGQQVDQRDGVVDSCVGVEDVPLPVLVLQSWAI